eukprot:TRINITY_DN5575_c0_g1_i2.p1 TRINITY_DN5575_c0_g1~~TRINITY_DN5575_c0_g1_i2.p1  ORF type:complete len:241 (+),score=45.70 TRINITY_DN5575_c0_g1_i2:373-1095(+)
MCIDFSANDDLVLAASNDNATRIWTVQRSNLTHTLTGHTNKVFAALFTTDGNRVVTGSHDRSIKIWEVSRGFCIRTISCFSSCNDIGMSVDGMILCSGHFDGALRFWDAKSGELAHEVESLHSGQITSTKVSPDGFSVLTSSRDNTLKTVDIRTFEVLQTFKHMSYRSGVNWNRSAWSPDGAYVLSGSDNGNIYIWDTMTRKINTILKGGHSTTVTACAWNPNGYNLVSCDKNGYTAIWD